MNLVQQKALKLSSILGWREYFIFDMSLTCPFPIFWWRNDEFASPCPVSVPVLRFWAAAAAFSNSMLGLDCQ